VRKGRRGAEELRCGRGREARCSREAAALSSSSEKQKHDGRRATGEDEAAAAPAAATAAETRSERKQYGRRNNNGSKPSGGNEGSRAAIERCRNAPMATRKPMGGAGSVCLDLDCWRVSVGSTGKAMEIKVLEKGEKERAGQTGCAYVRTVQGHRDIQDMLDEWMYNAYCPVSSLSLSRSLLFELGNPAWSCTGYTVQSVQSILYTVLLCSVMVLYRPRLQLHNALSPPSAAKSSDHPLKLDPLRNSPPRCNSLMRATRLCWYQ
jgi:hypothetical protein